MQQWVTVERVRMGGNEFALARRGDEWVVRLDNRVLMTSRMHSSEISLAETAIARATKPRKMLIGGLGLGYTLRAALDLLGPDARVIVAELVPELVEWNRNHFPHLHKNALDDPRCEIVVDDVYDVIARSQYDVIVLDVDNGPEPFSQEKNQRLYSDKGTRTLWKALKPGGVLGVWSAGENAKYPGHLERHGFKSEVLRVARHKGARGRHVLFLGTKPKA